MSEKYKNKYRIDSTRLKNWDYKWDAAYFITICTKDRIYYFGNVVNGKMQLNDIGDIAETEWLKTFKMRPDMNLLMGEFIIMPNHFHAIINIGENQYNSQSCNSPAPDRTDAMHCVCTSDNPIQNSINPIQNPANPNYNPADITQNTPQSKNQFGPQSKNLASIIRGFKIGVTTRARTIDSNFAWQPRYHEHIIRNDRSFKNISDYIKNNPENWQKDKFA